jgi:hypothetical protein
LRAPALSSPDKRIGNYPFFNTAKRVNILCHFTASGSFAQAEHQVNRIPCCQGIITKEYTSFLSFLPRKSEIS